MEHRTLSLGRQLGQGGQGTVYEVVNKKINEAEGGGWDVAYKEYTATVLPGLDATALASQVGLLKELSAADARWLSEKTAWPAAVVERDGHACGFLMRAIPDRFRFDYRSLGSTGTATRRLANLEFLLNDDAYVASVGLNISERDRLLLLADLAATLTRLHRMDIAVGDLSPKNLLFTTGPRPECFLIDCDAMRLRGATVLPQAETPDWQIPAGEEKATRTSDVYKFALLAVRLFARDQIATDPAALATASPALGALARAGLDPDPARRPAPAAWGAQLTAAAATASTAPAKKPAHRSTANTPPSPGPRRPTGNAEGLKVLAAVAAIIVVVIALVVAHSHSGSGSESSGSPQPRFSQSYPYDPSPGSSYGSSSSDGGSGSGSDGVAADPSTTAPSAEDVAFSEVSTDDCLSNYTNMDTDWTPATPSTTSCYGTDAYFRVASVEKYGSCTSDDITWYHHNDDGSSTDLCLNRNYATGQCMFAVARNQLLSMYFNAATPCEANIPSHYQYTVKLTQVYPNGAPADACGSDKQWKPDNSSAVLCGRAVYKLTGLPDM
ncbi:hypothetical protein [Streptomyces broussonetiae]|uniref:Protein kinase domain-containing protein n=1 Tax=Streptomyces broussonetiae TaxID=2686304 RepID=A0A6I6N283_9ACTN|nr:hypothetical protein [Streptomyces broussonetiae]QHA05524.1 hypothetical protein GQF42_21455 [Streptomyces broussonetiae]